MPRRRLNNVDVTYIGCCRSQQTNNERQVVMCLKTETLRHHAFTSWKKISINYRVLESREIKS